MAKPHELPPHGLLDGSELVHIEQDGDSRQSTLADILAIAHAVAIGDVTGLVAALAAKLDDTQAGAGGLAILAAVDVTAVRAAADVYSTAQVDAAIGTAVTGLWDLRGGTDCSGNPNYPAANKGDAYVVTVAGKIGGASGATVGIGDVYVALADNAGGTQAAVGASWDILVHASVAAGGGLLAANNLSDVANPATALANLGGAPKQMVVDTVAGTTYTFATADGYHHKRFTNAGAIVATVPTNASDAIPVGTRIRCTSAGAGQVTLTPAGGVTLNSRGGSLKSAGQFAVFEIEKVATDTWDVFGDVTT